MASFIFFSLMLRRFWNVSANGPVLPLSVPPTTGQSLQVCKAEGRKNESFSRLKTAEWSVHLPPSGMTSFLPAVLVLLGRKHSVDWGGSSGALCFAASVQGQPHLWEATTHLEKSAQCWITAPKAQNHQTHLAWFPLSCGPPSSGYPIDSLLDPQVCVFPQQPPL
jgi:hypothetical protein